MVDLTENFLLKSLDTSDRSLLQASMRPVSLTRGSVLYEPGQAITDVYFIGEGLVAMITSLDDGSTVQTSMVGRESGIGFVEACGGGIVHSRVVVQIDGWAWLAPATAYQEAFHASRSLRETITQHIEVLLTEGRQEVACCARHSARQRLARWLLVCEDRAGKTRFPFTQDMLAAVVGAQRATISGTAHSLKKAGILAYTRTNLSVIDKPALEAVACECYAAMKAFRQRMGQPLPLAWIADDRHA